MTDTTGPGAAPEPAPQFVEADLRGARFSGTDLRGSRFDDVRLDGAQLRSVTLVDTGLRNVRLERFVVRDAELVDVDLSGELRRVVVNGVDVVPLVEAELDRRDPERPLVRPTDADGFRLAWDVVERRWAATVERARRLDPALLHVSVDDEWSFVQTLRHLVFATDAWVRRALLGDPAPWHPLGLPWGDAPDDQGFPNDPAARPDLDEVLALRADRMATVRRYVDGLTDAALDAMTEPVPGPGWPPPVAHSVRACLRVVLNEEWEHRVYAERDLAVLEARD